jgi:hypothetical protein
MAWGSLGVTEERETLASAKANSTRRFESGRVFLYLVRLA